MNRRESRLKIKTGTKKRIGFTGKIKTGPKNGPV
jgi:hypothetical protein